MEKPELTKEESKTYINIVKKGNMDDMFDYGYAVGQQRQAKKSIEILESSMKLTKLTK